MNNRASFADSGKRGGNTPNKRAEISILLILPFVFSESAVFFIRY